MDSNNKCNIHPQYIHTYVYECWKICKNIIDGNTDKSKIGRIKLELQQKVTTLYQKGQAILSLYEKNYFELPLEQHQKEGVESLTL